MTLYGTDVYSGSSDSIVTDPHSSMTLVKATQGTYYVNPKANHQYELAKSKGNLLGAYHYAGGGDPVQEARYFINNIKNWVGEAVLAVDWEEYQNTSWGDTTWVRRFVDEVHRLTGVWCLIYVQESAIGQVANCANDCGLWVAKYASMNWNSWNVPNMGVNTYPWKTWTIWQFTGGDMDRNVLNVDADGWHKLAKPNGVITQPQAPKPVVKPQDTPKSFVDDLHVTWYLEKGKFIVTADEGIVLRWGATTKSAKIGVLPKGSVVKYDSFCHSGGYVWIRQPRGNGQYGYLPTGESSGGKRTSIWGKFE